MKLDARDADCEVPMVRLRRKAAGAGFLEIV